MKKIALLLLLMTAGLIQGFGQTARQVLDKCAATVSAKDGVQAKFKVNDGQGTLSGTIAVKGRKFYAATAHGIMWFDGKTQWTYLKKNDEVSVVNPTEAQLQAINPYNFINMYKRGYNYTMNTSTQDYTVHLTASDKKLDVKELFIIVDKKSYAPTQVKMLRGKKWTTFDISDLKQMKLSDADFSFNAKDYPTAEVIDLR